MTDAEIALMEKWFSMNPYPTQDERFLISEMMEMPEKKVRDFLFRIEFRQIYYTILKSEYKIMKGLIINYIKERQTYSLLFLKVQ